MLIANAAFKQVIIIFFSSLMVFDTFDLYNRKRLYDVVHSSVVYFKYNLFLLLIMFLSRLLYQGGEHLFRVGLSVVACSSITIFMFDTKRQHLFEMSLT